MSSSRAARSIPPEEHPRPPGLAAQQAEGALVLGEPVSRVVQRHEGIGQEVHEVPQREAVGRADSQSTA